MSIDPALLEIFACPQCHAPLKESALKESALKESAEELVCTGADCGLAYPVRDGIPVLLIDEARRPD
jgi:uncharacterized protein YbaR (Trm112 family)